LSTSFSPPIQGESKWEEQISGGEHGLGYRTKVFFNEREDPGKIALMKRIKAAFDPNGILNPGKVFD
jgi:FAD/FMN-containing dehydrogenase